MPLYVVPYSACVATSSRDTGGDALTKRVVCAKNRCSLDHLSTLKYRGSMPSVRTPNLCDKVLISALWYYIDIFGLHCNMYRNTAGNALTK